VRCPAPGSFRCPLEEGFEPSHLTSSCVESEVRAEQAGGGWPKGGPSTVWMEPVRPSTQDPEGFGNTEHDLVSLKGGLGHTLVKPAVV
jgi:hypothetical protein